MKKTFLKKIIVILITTIFLNNSSTIGQNYTETLETEEITNGVNTFKVKRRSITYDENLKIKKEIYFGFKEDSYETQILGIVEYSKSDSIEKIITYRKYPQKYIEIDFKNGSYKNYTNKTHLKFKQDFHFDGLQNGNKIVVNYKDGKRHGVCLQTDSGVVTTKNVIVQRPDVRLLQFDIIKFSSQIESENVYKLFNGLVCSFVNDKLNGNVNGFFINGNKKFESKYENDILTTFNSYDKNGLTTFKIPITKNGIINGNIIFNGSISSEYNSSLVINEKINNVGKINSYSLFNTFKNSDQIENQLRDKNNSLYVDFFNSSTKYPIRKSLLDKYKIILTDPDQFLSLFEIPKFEIQRFEDSDENNFCFYRTVPDSLNTSTINDIIDELESFNVGFYKDKSMLTSNFIIPSNLIGLWSSINNNGKRFYIKNVDQTSVTMNEKEETNILLKNIKTIIFNSILMKKNLQNFIKPDINNVVWFSEKNGTRLRLIDEMGIKYVEISLESNDIYERVKKNLYTYFDGKNKYNLLFNVSTNDITLEKSWIE
jgi:hypothetical protein